MSMHIRTRTKTPHTQQTQTNHVSATTSTREHCSDKHMRSVVSNKHAAAHRNARALACMELENIYQKVLVFVFKRTWGTAPASGPGSCFHT
jgi:hypothetical protein